MARGRRRRRGRLLVFVPENHQSFQLRLHRAPQQLRLRRRHIGGQTSGSSSCLWGSCSPSTPSPGSTPARTSRRRPGGLPVGRPRASGSRSPTRRSAAGSCCWRSSSPPPKSLRSTPRAASPAHLRPRSTRLPQDLHHHLHHGPALLRRRLPDRARRMTYAFSRDGAVPGWRILVQGRPQGTPVNAISAWRWSAWCMTLPASEGELRRHPDRLLRGRLGRRDRALPGVRDPDRPRCVWGTVRAGPWTLGRKYKWIGPIAVTEIVIIAVYFVPPTVPAGAPWQRRVHLVGGELRAARPSAGVLLLVADSGWLRLGPQVVHRPGSYRRGTPRWQPTRRGPTARSDRHPAGRAVLLSRRPSVGFAALAAGGIDGDPVCQ